MARYTRPLKKNADHQRVKFGPKCAECFCGPVDKMWSMKVRTTAVSAIISPSRTDANSIISPAPNHIPKPTANRIHNHIPNRNMNLTVKPNPNVE